MAQDLHISPPAELRNVFKKWQKCKLEYLTHHPDVLDTADITVDTRVQRLNVSTDLATNTSKIFEEFVQPGLFNREDFAINLYELRSLPGLLIIPSLLPSTVQLSLLDKLLHRDLINPMHKTNLHPFYDLPSSQLPYFGLDQKMKLRPRDPDMHKPISMKQVLEKKLRWLTLGGQYDWTNKVYPDEKPPQFPEDIAQLVRGPFPEVNPQAAILNFYSPGDTLSLHRDVSEDCDRDLVSISIGCDALFMVSNATTSENVTLRIRSGDAVIMSGAARYAWHAVPKVIAGTCPPELRSWPASDDQSYEEWRGWLANKRLNLNVRQMRLDPYEYVGLNNV